MSFILDALKKSEIERQRQAIPGLMDSGTAPARARLPLDDDPLPSAPEASPGPAPGSR